MLGNLLSKVIIAALIYRYVVKITSYKTHAEHRTAWYQLNTKDHCLLLLLLGVV